MPKKRKIMKFSFIALALIAILLVAFILQMHYYDTKNSLGVMLSPGLCEALFGVTPEEFFNTDFEFYRETGDLRKNASIDEEDGTLIIILSGKQRKKWRESEWLSPFAEVKNNPKFEISADMSTLTLYLKVYFSRFVKS